MIQGQIKKYYDRLSCENHKSFYLAFLRVALSLWLLKEIGINWASADLLYGESAFVVLKHTPLNHLPNGGFAIISTHYRWVTACAVIVILLNVLGIGRRVTAAAVFLMMELLQKMNLSFINNGDRMAALLFLYLVFADSYQYFVLIKRSQKNEQYIKLQNLFSNLAALSIMLLLCLAYLASGLAKLSDPVWLHGEGTYYALSMERFTGTAFNKYLVQYPWLDMVSNYAVMAFELLFPLLIWVRKWRKELLTAGIILHLCIYIFLMIYGFQVIFVLIYGLFLSNEKLLAFVRKFAPVSVKKGLSI